MNFKRRKAKKIKYKPIWLGGKINCPCCAEWICLNNSLKNKKISEQRKLKSADDQLKEKE